METPATGCCFAATEQSVACFDFSYKCFWLRVMITLDVYFDFACPWCYVGFLRFLSVGEESGGDL